MFWLPSFGDRGCFGHNLADLHIDFEANHNYRNHSNLGDQYEAPDGMKYRSDAARSYLAGTFYFKVSDLEIFRLNFK